MKLFIDGHEVVARPEQSLLDIIKSLGLIKGKLSTDPLVAKMAGREFTLNYIPVRLKDIATSSDTVRTAVNASGGVIKLLRYSDPMGRDVYTRTAQFVLFLAIHQLWPGARAKMDFKVRSGLYIKVEGAQDFSAVRLKKHVEAIINADIPILRKRISKDEAIEYYKKKGETDKVDLLFYRQVPYLEVYKYGDYADYFYGEMAPSTSFLRSWDIITAPEGFMFIYPDTANPDKVSSYKESPNFFKVCNESKKWCELMECETISDLNRLVDTGRIRELIRVNEALHEKSFSDVADEICARGARAVLLAGPSSSGKTTSANRLATQLRGHGKKPLLMSLDDYYLDRDKIAPGPDGKLDLEHINTIDTELFAKNLAGLLSGEEVELPTFDFPKQRRVWTGRKLRLTESTVIIIEGLHALNPMLIPEGLDSRLIYKMYVTPLLPISLDNHNRVTTSYLRLLRRIVRDNSTRNSPVQKTLSMWDSVRRGEEKWIFPFQENADVIFNSSTLYELAVLKKHIFPLLTVIGPEDEYYTEVRAIVKVLNFVHEAEVDDEIPPTSLVREFIGGNTFYR